VAYRGCVLVVTRHPRSGPAGRDLLAEARDLLDVLTGLPGFRRGWVASAVDDPDVVLVVHEWDDVGSWRRALGSFDVKTRTPFLLTAADEPSAFEVLTRCVPGERVDAESAHERAADPGAR
jgi:hypothetical protein